MKQQKNLVRAALVIALEANPYEWRKMMAAINFIVNEEDKAYLRFNQKLQAKKWFNHDRRNRRAAR